MKIAIHLLAGFSLLLTTSSSVSFAENVSTASSADISQNANLFDGETLSGWQVKGNPGAEDQWSVVDGCIVTENDGGSGSDLWTEKA